MPIASTCPVLMAIIPPVTVGSSFILHLLMHSMNNDAASENPTSAVYLKSSEASYLCGQFLSRCSLQYRVDLLIFQEE